MQSVRWAAEPLWDGNIVAVASKLLGAVQRHLSIVNRFKRGLTRLLLVLKALFHP